MLHLLCQQSAISNQGTVLLQSAVIGMKMAGMSQTGKTGLIALLCALGLFGCLGIVLFLSRPHPLAHPAEQSPTSPQLAPNRLPESEVRAHESEAIYAWLRDHLNDADSLKDVQFKKRHPIYPSQDQRKPRPNAEPPMPDGTIRVIVSYRAKNQFGAWVLQQTLFFFSPDGKLLRTY